MVFRAVDLEVPKHPHRTRFKTRCQAQAMDELGEEGRMLYQLVRSELIADLDARLKEQGDVLLKSMGRLLEANNATLLGLMFVRVDGVREEMALDLE